jgi:serine/threonine protein kinase
MLPGMKGVVLMDVEISGVLMRLEQHQVIGTGGEGTVFLVSFRGQQIAVKVYHQATAQRQKKLSALLAWQWNIPVSRIALPLEEVKDSKRGITLGFTMPYFGADFEEIARLANKKHRTNFLISTKDVVSIFLDGAQTLDAIHQNGLVVGDFSDQNTLYQQHHVLWIDVDAWQFASYPCPVGTEDFLAPELYGIDLSWMPVFLPEHDWYTFAVHLFRSLLLAHPYGGVHKTVQSLAQRAQQRIFLLNPDVTYPRIAYPPELLSDELLHQFERIFARGERGKFPIDILNRYYDSLVACTSCKMEYPRSRLTCPLCSARTMIVLQQPLVNPTGVLATELLRTQGKIIFSKVQGQAIYVVAYEQGRAVLYRIRLGVSPQRIELFKEIPGARYDLIGDALVVNVPQTRQLLFLDVSGEKPQALFQAETALFAGTRKAMFSTSYSHIYYIQNSALLCGAIMDGTLHGRSLRTVMEKQTWFTVAPTADGDKASVFGFFQVFRQQLYWYIHDHSVYDVALPPLNDEEALIDIAVYFSDADALIRRHSHEQGVDYLRSEVIDTSGNIIYTSAKMKRGDHPCPELFGQAYATGVVLHATDQGIMQEKIDGGFKTFTATRNYVQAGDTLEQYQLGLLVISEDRVRYLVL